MNKEQLKALRTAKDLVDSIIGEKAAPQETVPEETSVTIAAVRDTVGEEGVVAAGKKIIFMLRAIAKNQMGILAMSKELLNLATVAHDHGFAAFDDALTYAISEAVKQELDELVRSINGDAEEISSGRL